jgi:hypothetical protein
MASSLVKLPGQNVLDPVNLGCHVAWREGGNLGDRGGVEPFEIGNDDLAVEGLQLTDEFEKPLQSSTSVRVRLAVLRIGCRFGLLERDQRRQEVSTPPADVRGGGIVRDPINPRSQRTAPVESFETAPQCEVNFLEQVSPAFRIRFVSACEPFECGAESGGGLTVKIRLSLPHI